ncbi:MAG: hypothetical protein AAF708_17270 [Deinococcota bacterium]
MPKLYFGEAFALIGKTMPFIWARLGSYTVLGLALLVYFGIMGGIAWLLGQLWNVLGILVFLLALGGAVGVIRWVTRYYFYLLKAAHTAVMTEVIVYKKVPDGGQINYGKQQVTSRFRDTSIMFGVDALLDGITKAFTRNFARLGRILPIPGLDGLMGLLERVAVFSTTFIDEAILSRAYKERESNVWKVAHDGVILYAQAWQPILANAVVLALISFGQFLLFLILLGLPAVAIGSVLPEPIRPALGVGVIVLAWLIKVAVADAFALAATLIAYHRSTENLAPNPEWQAKLEGVSDKFRDLGQRAAEAAGRRSAGGSIPSAGDVSPEGAS